MSLRRSRNVSKGLTGTSPASVTKSVFLFRLNFAKKCDLEGNNQIDQNDYVMSE